MSITDDQIRDIYVRLERLERLDEQFATLTASIETRFDNLDNRIDALDATVNNNRDEVLRLRDVSGDRHDAVMAALEDIRAGRRRASAKQN